MHEKSVPNNNESPFFIYISYLPPTLLSKLHDVESSLIGFIPMRNESEDRRLYSTYFSLSKVLCGSSYSHSSGKWRTMIERKSPFKFNHFDCAVLSIQSALSLEGSPFGSILKVPIATSDTNCEWRSKFLSFRANFVWVHNSPIYDECQTQ